MAARFFELKQKFSARRSDARLQWTLWEPNSSHRDAMISKLAAQNVEGVTVLQSASEIIPGDYDVVYISNVLHELSIEEFVELIETAVLAGGPDGMIVVSEVYPLLHPEWFAVPYSEGDLKECFRVCGFRVTPLKLRFRIGDGYCLAISAAHALQKFDANTIRSAIATTWKKIKSDLIKDYQDNHSANPLNLESYTRDIQGVMTIARITSWEQSQLES